MAKRRKSGSKAGIFIFIIIIVIIASAGLLAYIVLSGKGVDSNPVAKSVNRVVTKKAVDAVIRQETGEDITLDEIKAQMSTEDAEEVDSILNKYADEGLLSEAAAIYKANGGDIGATASAVKDKVSDEDIDKLYELYKKYAEDLNLD
ncbi:MAG: hypothetical protein K5770_00325 [Lachnospiraceae bacterium]|nr:hypothetical protein [Lachnospiraceae bacterium]